MSKIKNLLFFISHLPPLTQSFEPFCSKVTQKIPGPRPVPEFQPKFSNVKKAILSKFNASNQFKKYVIQISYANYPGMMTGFPNQNDLNLATTIILVLLKPINPQKAGEKLSKIWQILRISREIPINRGYHLYCEVPMSFQGLKNTFVCSLICLL